MEEHLHSEGVRCPRQGEGAEYIINVIYYIYLSIYMFHGKETQTSSEKLAHVYNPLSRK